MSPYEVEVKIPCEAEEIIPRLEEAGYTFEREIHQRDRYFDAPNRSFADTDEALRIREITATDRAETFRLTYKGPRRGEAAKTRLEHEVAIDSPEHCSEILTALGFSEAIIVVKHRREYTTEEMTATVDRVDGLGTFLELERVVDDQSIEHAAQMLDREATRLGLGDAPTITKSYVELLSDANR